MKFYLRPILILILGFAVSAARAQEKVYSTSGWEFIFSGAQLKDNGNEIPSVMRFTLVVNMQNYLNVDMSDNFGWFTGLAVRNVGFIYDVPNTGLRKKIRTYNLGIPIGVKVGNLDKAFFFGGYEIEFPFNYRERTFDNEVRTEKFSVWFSDRTPVAYHTIMVGIQLPQSATIKFKYYLNNYLNKDFTETDSNGMTTQPFQFLDVNVFYFSLSFNLFRNTRFYHSSYWQDRD